MQEMKLHETLAAGVDPLLLRDAASRIRELEHHNGKLFVDLVED